MTRTPRLGLTAICLGFLMITLDATIVNVALGPIVADLGGHLAAAQWIVNGYTLAFAALLLSAGALADRIGARTGFLIGLTVFTLGSALCSVAGSMDLLIGARVIQGTGAAWLMPASLALITHTFPEGPERRRALAVWGGVSGIGLASGPILGGVLTSAVGWRAIFLVNVPVAVLAALLLLGHVAETRRESRALDLPGQVLGISALSLLTAGFILAGQDGWLAPMTLILIGGGVLAGVAFLGTEHRVPHPMVDPILFQRPTFSRAVGVGVIFNFCLYGALFCLAIDLHETRGLSAFGTGLAMLPMTLVTGTTAYATGRVIDRFGEWRVMTAGLGAGALGAVAVALEATHGPLWLLVLATVPLGLTALAMPAMTAAAMSGAPAARVGLASGVLNAARQIGGALGVAVLGALLGVGGAVALHLPFSAIAAAYAVGVGVAITGTRLSAGPSHLNHRPSEPTMISSTLPTPVLTQVFRLEARLGTPLDLGEIPSGHRRIVPLTEGHFTGPELNGDLVPGVSADWQIVLADGTALGDIRYTLRTDAGHLLNVQSRGVRHGSAEVLERLSWGEPVDPSEYTFRTATQIETSSPDLDWLNKGVFIGVACRRPGGVVYEVYLVG